MAINNREKYLGAAFAGALAFSIPGHANAEGKICAGGTQTYSGAGELGLIYISNRKTKPDQKMFKVVESPDPRYLGAQIIGNDPDQLLFVYTPSDHTVTIFPYSAYERGNPNIQDGLNRFVGEVEPTSTTPFTRCQTTERVTRDVFDIDKLPKGTRIVDTRIPDTKFAGKTPDTHDVGVVE